MVFKRFGKVQCSRGKKEWDNYVEADAISMSPDQVPTGRWFQLRDGSGSGIGKNFGFGFGCGFGYGIGFGYWHRIFYESGIIGY